MSQVPLEQLPLAGVRIVAVEVDNFRSLRRVAVTLDDYTVCIGANGAGKSSLLYALDWFFGGRPIHDEDRSVLASEDDVVRVAVTFEWPRGAEPSVGTVDEHGRIRVSRSWRGAKDEAWAIDGPACADFMAVRDANLGPAERRAAYRALRELPGFADLPDRPGNIKVDTLIADVGAWEDDHAATLPRAERSCSPNEAASIVSGISFVLVPASTNMSNAIDEGRSSLVDRLTGPLLGRKAESICADWASKHQDELAQLRDDLEAALEGVADEQSARVNAELELLVPGVSIDATPVEVGDPSGWLPTQTPGVRVSVLVNGEPRSTSRQGHGVQRAVLMAMLQAAATPRDGAAASAADAPTTAKPATVVAIEEPEVYQHPQRARQIAAALSLLAERGDLQLVVATHSPLFIKPAHFSLLRRFSLDVDGCTVVMASSAHGVAGYVVPWAGPDDDDFKEAVEKATRRLEKELPFDLSESFFAERVVIVEGTSDRAVIEAIAEDLDPDLAQLGVAFVRVSKDGIPLTSAILRALGIDTYEVFDGDALGYLKKPKEKQEATRNSHRAASERLLKRLNVLERERSPAHQDVRWEGATATHSVFTMLHADLEHELAAWRSHQVARAQLGVTPGSKDEFGVRLALQQSRVDDCPENLTRMVRTALGA
jgi:putative ATP-dependent endonuclease of OLD family